MRILVDMNLTPRWCKLLESRQHEAFHWSLIGPIGASDREIFEYARYSGIHLLTTDIDFPRILAHTVSYRPSTVILRGEPLTPEVRGLAVLDALKEYRFELIAGAILLLDWSSTPRARILAVSPSCSSPVEVGDSY